MTGTTINNNNESSLNEKQAMALTLLLWKLSPLIENNFEGLSKKDQEEITQFIANTLHG